MTELEAITTAQLQTKQAVKGLEPLLEALIAAYVNGTKEVKAAITQIQAVKENKEVSKLLKSIDKSIGSYPKIEVIQEQKQTLKALQDVVKAIEKKDLSVDLITIDLSRVEKCLEAIEQLIKIPLDDGRVAVKLSEKDLERLTRNIGSVWQASSTTNKLANASGQEINPATEDTLALLLTQLQAINTNTDTLELKAENVNLNTDQLESKLDSLLTELQQKTEPTNTQPVSAASLPLPTGAATETTLTQVRDYLDTVETKLQAIADNTSDLEVNTDALEARIGDTTDAEATGNGSVNAVLKRIRTLLADLSTRASEATLVQVRDYLDGVEGKLDTLISQTDGLETNTTGLATNATLIQVRDYLDTVETKLDSIQTELSQKTEPADTQPVSAASLPLPSGAATSAKQDTSNTSLASIDADLEFLKQLSIPAHDYISLGYTGDNLTSVVYKTGGSGGTTVATLTLAYTGSNLTSVTKS